MLERFSTSSALNLSALKPKAASFETNMSHLKKINCDNDIHITLDGSEAIMLHLCVHCVRGHVYNDMHLF